MVGIVLPYSVYFTTINCFRCLDGIPECVVAQFHEAAEELIREKGATSAVAAALTYIAGAKDIVSRSLLSAHQVYSGAWHCILWSILDFRWGGEQG